MLSDEMVSNLLHSDKEFVQAALLECVDPNTAGSLAGELIDFRDRGRMCPVTCQPARRPGTIFT